MRIRRRSEPARAPWASPPPPPRRLRPALFLAAIGVYALAFIVWCTCFEGEHGRGLAALFPKGYDERINRMLALLTSKRQQHTDAFAAAAGEVAPAAAFECLGWRHTMDCDPNSDVLQSFNRSCSHHVRGGQAGFCALRERATGREVRVMRATCTTVRPDVLFTCDQALDFVHFRHEVRATIAHARAANAAAATSTRDRSNGAPSGQQLRTQQQQQTQLTSKPLNTTTETRGIVMVAYPKLLVSAYTVVRTLRESLNCSLPIELWYLASEMGGANATAPSSVLQTLRRDFGPVSLHAIAPDAGVTGFNSKIYAIAHTKLTHVLFLDADNIPVKDPTFLFETPEYERTGAVFWPDFWHPDYSIFNVNNASLLWELLDMNFVDMFEQESGQLVIDKRRSTVALQTLQFFAFRQPSIFESLKLAWGDKDLFRLAWLKTNSSFHMVARPPAIAGALSQSKFCGMTMAQFDPAGDHIVFLHRNAMKLNGGRPGLGKDADAEIWTHLQTFAWQSNTSVRTNETTLAAVKATAQGAAWNTPPVAASRMFVATTTATSTTTALSASSHAVRPNASTTTNSNTTVDYTRLKQFFKVAIFNGAPQFPPTQWCYGRESPTLEAHFRTVPWSATPFAGVEREILRFARAGAALLPVGTVDDVIMVPT